MAENNQDDQNKKDEKLKKSSGVAHDSGEKKIDGNGSGEDTSKKCHPGFDLPQPFIVKQEKEEKSWLKRRTVAEGISVFALFISIFAVVLNKCSLDNTTRAVNISDSALQQTRKNFEVENRAYITFILAKADSFIADKKLSVIATIRNYGKNPTLINKTITDLHYTQSPTIKPVDTSKINTRYWNIYLPTNGNINIPFDSVVITTDKLKEINNGKLFMHLHGLVEYYEPALNKTYQYRYSVIINKDGRFSPTIYNNILIEVSGKKE